MRISALLCTVSGLALLASCASHHPHVPQPPVPAVLTEYEAFDLVTAHIDSQGHNLAPLRRREMRDWGYAFYYESEPGWDAEPPKSSQVIAIRHDGTIREWLSDDEQN